MGVGVYLRTESPVDGVDTSGMDGKALARDLVLLDQFATENSISTLSSFVSFSLDDLVGAMGNFGFDPGDAVVPEEKWFASSVVLTVVRNLLPLVQNKSATINKVDQLLADLTDLERLLSLAAERGVRVHLTMDTP